MTTHTNCYTLRTARCTLLALMLAVVALCQAQTPVANRVKAAAEALPKGCQVVAKYTDNQRHCLYYTANNRLYKYDVLTNKKHEVSFSSEAYARIVSTYITEQGKYLFVLTDKDMNAKAAPESQQVLWRINSFNGSSKKIATGFDIKKDKDNFVVRVITRRETNNKDNKKTVWKAKDCRYQLDGQVMFAGEEYIIDK